MDYTIYLRTNKVNGMQYVGQTGDFERRELQWKNIKFIYANHYFTEERNKYGLDSFETSILAEVETQEEAWELERKYIKELGTKYPDGYNMSDGGKGNKGKIVSEETRKKFSVLFKGKHHSPKTEFKKGNKLSEETKKKMSESRKGENNSFYGKHHTEETIKKISELQKGQHRSPKTEFPKRKVNQYDLEGNFIRTWPSISEIQRELGFKTNSSIIQCCKGKYKQSYGFKWQYA